MIKTFFLNGLLTVSLLAGIAAAEPTVIELTQVPCQFLEIEAKDHKFVSKQSLDCKVINSKTGRERMALAKTLRLKPGDHIFRITNKNVPYTLGFFLRSFHIFNRLKLSSVSGGGLKMGKTRDYKVTLKEGEYYFSCPLNPTLDYKLVVAK